MSFGVSPVSVFRVVSALIETVYIKTVRHTYRSRVSDQCFMLYFILLLVEFLDLFSEALNLVMKTFFSEKHKVLLTFQVGVMCVFS